MIRQPLTSLAPLRDEDGPVIPSVSSRGSPRDMGIFLGEDSFLPVFLWLRYNNLRDERTRDSCKNYLDQDGYLEL